MSTISFFCQALVSTALLQGNLAPLARALGRRFKTTVKFASICANLRPHICLVNCVLAIEEVLASEGAILCVDLRGREGACLQLSNL